MTIQQVQPYFFNPDYLILQISSLVFMAYQFQYQEYWEMLTNANEKQTEQLAKKHGRATNQRSSFTNLIKGKIVRSQRPVDDKENQKSTVTVQPKYSQSLNQNKVLKIKEKNNSITTVSEKCPKFEQEMLRNKYKSQKYQKTLESSIEAISQSSEYRTYTLSDYNDIAPISLNLPSFRLTTVDQQVTSETSCMTDECYYQKQLEIKVQILKKERDQLWDSINGIVRQNNLLKETLEALALKKSNASCESTQTESKQNVSQGFQTDTAQAISKSLQTDEVGNQPFQVQTDQLEAQAVSIQTQLSNDQLQLLQLRYQKAARQRHQVLQFCETLYLQDVSEELSECLSMKDAITEYLSIKIDGLIKQFDSEKAMLNKMYEQYINKFKRNEEELLERNQGLLIDLQEARSINKKLQQHVQAYENKTEMLEESNYILNNELIEAEEEIVEYKRQAQLIKESLESEKKGWEAKKRTYTSLLASSHKTINNLMAQMKQFEELASSTHHKRLKTQKGDQSTANDI